jgi:hypothetical protein
MKSRRKCGFLLRESGSGSPYKRVGPEANPETFHRKQTRPLLVGGKQLSSQRCRRIGIRMIPVLHDAVA